MIFHSSEDRKMETKQNKRDYKAHVLLISLPTQGHINPILQFSKRLASKGVKATVATTLHLAESIHLTDRSTNHLLQIGTISDGYDHGGYAVAESTEVYNATFRQVGSRTLANLINKLADSGHPVSGLVYDTSLPWALDVGKEFGLVKVAFSTQSCAVGNVYYHIYKGLVELPLSGDVVSVPGLPPLKRPEVPSFANHPELYKVFLEVVTSRFSSMEEADWVLHNTFYELEPQVVDYMAKFWRLRTIGPMVPSMYLDKRIQDDTQYSINLFKPNTITCENWLNQRPSGTVVYVSIGSVSTQNAEQMEEMACALKASGYNFLWVVREEEQAKLPHNFAEETSEKGLVVSWCRQLDVLAHDSVGCFVSHCGFNSVLETLSLGVPVVAVPHWSDQNTNAKFVEDVWGIGIRAWPDENGVLRRDELELKIREVMEMEGERGEMMKKNVMKWRNLAKEAMQEGGSSDKNIDELIDDLVRSCGATFVKV